MTQSNNNDKELDRRISELIRSESPAPYADEWFTRKTVNRLPPRRRRLVSLPELAGFVIVVAVCVLVIVREMKLVLSLADPATFNPAMLLAAAAMAVCATLYITIPILRQC